MGLADNIEPKESNRFLRWGPQDWVFRRWLEWFIEHDVPVRVGTHRASNGATKWTLYKEMREVDDLVEDADEVPPLRSREVQGA